MYLLSCHLRKSRVFQKLVRVWQKACFLKNTPFQPFPTPYPSRSYPLSKSVLLHKPPTYPLSASKTLTQFVSRILNSSIQLTCQNSRFNHIQHPYQVLFSTHLNSVLAFSKFQNLCTVAYA